MATYEGVFKILNEKYDLATETGYSVTGFTLGENPDASDEEVAAEIYRSLKGFVHDELEEMDLDS